MYIGLKETTYGATIQSRTYSDSDGHSLILKGPGFEEDGYVEEWMFFNVQVGVKLTLQVWRQGASDSSRFTLIGDVPLTSPSTVNQEVTLSAGQVGTVYVRKGDLLGLMTPVGKSAVPYDNVTCPNGEVLVVKYPSPVMRRFTTYSAIKWPGDATHSCRQYSLSAKVVQCMYFI